MRTVTRTTAGTSRTTGGSTTRTASTATLSDSSPPTGTTTTGGGGPGCRWRHDRAKAADVTDAGVQTTDGLCDTVWRWPAIVRYRETANLLVLTTEDARQLILPKRFYPADEESLRAVIQTHVAQGTFLPRATAFPVMAVAAEASG